MRLLLRPLIALDVVIAASWQNLHKFYILRCFQFVRVCSLEIKDCIAIFEGLDFFCFFKMMKSCVTHIPRRTWLNLITQVHRINRRVRYNCLAKRRWQRVQKKYNRPVDEFSWKDLANIARCLRSALQQHSSQSMTAEPCEASSAPILLRHPTWARWTNSFLSVIASSVSKDVAQGRGRG